MCATVHVTPGLSAMEMFATLGIVADVHNPPRHLQLFAAQADRAMEECRALVEQDQMTPEAEADFQQLLLDTCARVMCHPIVAGNRYLERFAQGVTFAQARHELQQFSVFAAQFDVAQAKLVANAPTVEAYEERMKLLLN
jgi:hypothetical protein